MGAKTNPAMKDGPDATGKRRRFRIMAVVATAASVAIGLISCGTTRTVLAPPEIPGAQFVGSETCKECHAEIVKNFATATHARLQVKGATALNVGCESCHGAGSLHNQSGGAHHTIINPN